MKGPKTKAHIWLGSFSTVEMPTRAYDAGMVCSEGELANLSLNFPDSVPRIHSKFLNPLSLKNIQVAAAATTTSSVPATKPLFIPPTQWLMRMRVNVPPSLHQTVVPKTSISPVPAQRRRPPTHQMR